MFFIGGGMCNNLACKTAWYADENRWGNAVNNPPKTGVDPGVTTVRWAQHQTHNKVPKTFMATAIDLAAYAGGCGHDTW